MPGASVGVVHGGELAWNDSIGFADVSEGRAAEASPFGPIESVTILRLLSHESGLAGDPPDTDWAGPTYEGLAERTLARAPEIGTRVAPHLQHKYSNLGYQLLGEVVARVSGVAYVEYVTREIIDRLGMRGTSFEPLSEPLLKRTATGYASPFLTDDPNVAPTPPNTWAEGGLWSSVDDLGSWITLQLSGAKTSLEDGVLQPSTLRQMHRPRFLADEAWAEAWGSAGMRADGTS